MNTHAPSAGQQLLVWWILWAVFQAGVVIFYFMLTRPAPAPDSPAADSLPWLVGAVPVFFSAIIRWLVLPRCREAQQALPLFVIGIAMAEAACFLGIFIFREHQRDLFILSVLGIAQFAPLFARRYVEQPDAGRLRDENL